MAEARMTKTQVIKHVAEKVCVSKKDVAAVLAATVDLAVQQTKKTGIFVFPDLGRLKKRQSKARMGRNPATGEPIKIAAKTTAKFYLAKPVKDAIAPPKAKKTG
jgi:DNA-binding protein HU-beta